MAGMRPGKGVGKGAVDPLGSSKGSPAEPKPKMGRRTPGKKAAKVSVGREPGHDVGLVVGCSGGEFPVGLEVGELLVVEVEDAQDAEVEELAGATGGG